MRLCGKSPIDPAVTRVGSPFGWRPGRTTGAETFHAGLDFVSKTGEPVRAVLRGQVALIGLEKQPRGLSGYGNAIVLFHPDLGLYSFYAHLSKVAVTPGQTVAAGQVIGAVGNTTNGKFPGMGAHLHFEMRKPRADGSIPFPGAYREFNVDPAPVLANIGVRTTENRYVRETCVVPGLSAVEQDLLALERMR
jgi:murein DD-endopeptidase MepM/ murein hydrolase activator NlpD